MEELPTNLNLNVDNLIGSSIFTNLQTAYSYLGQNNYQMGYFYLKTTWALLEKQIQITDEKAYIELSAKGSEIIEKLNESFAPVDAGVPMYQSQERQRKFKNMISGIDEFQKLIIDGLYASNLWLSQKKSDDIKEQVCRRGD